MIRVLQVGYSGLGGGVDKFINDLHQAINPKEFRIDYLIYNYVDKEEIQRLEDIGSKVFLVPKYSKHPVAFLKKIYSFYRNHPEYKVIHCHASHASTIMYTMPIWLKRNISIIFHSHNSKGNCVFLHKILSRIIILRCNHLLACSYSAANWMYGLKRNNIEIICNGIDLKKFLPSKKINDRVREELEVDLDDLIFGHVGEFREQKNHLFLIDIFRELYMKNNRCRLILIGEGELKNSIEKRVSECCLEKVVFFLGEKSDVEKYYQTFDAFLLPSLYEGLPFVGIEAQASGIPVFCSDNITTELKITSNVHFLSLMSPPEEWANYILAHIANVKQNNEKIMKDKGYDFSSTVKKLEKIYSDNRENI